MFLRKITYCSKCQLTMGDKRFFSGIYYEHFQDGVRYFINVDNNSNPAIACWDCFCEFLKDSECFVISIGNHREEPEKDKQARLEISINPKIKHSVLNPFYKIFFKAKRVLFQKLKIKQASIINSITMEVPNGNTK
jgi:hypothetical protein